MRQSMILSFIFLFILTAAPIKAPAESDKDPLLSNNIKTRQQAMIDLAKSQNIERTRELIRSKDFSLRKAAVFALSRWGSPQHKSSAHRVLKEALNDESFIIQFEAAKTLGFWGYNDGEAILVKGLLDTNSSRRDQAAKALYFVGSSLAIKNLIYNLRDADNSVRKSSVKTLRRITGQNFNYDPIDPRYLVMDQSQRRELFDLRKEILQELQTSDNEKNTALKTRRLEALENVSDEFKSATDERVLKLNQQREKAIRDWQQWWLDNKTGDRMNWLIGSLDHESPQTRRLAILTLAEMNAAEAYDSIAQKLDDPQTDVVTAACKALAQLKQKRSIGPLIEVLKTTQSTDSTDNDLLIRNYAAYQALLEVTQANFSSLASIWENWWDKSQDFFAIKQDLPHGKFNIRGLSISGNQVRFEVKFFHETIQDWLSSEFSVSLEEEVGTDQIEQSFKIGNRTFKRSFDMRTGLILSQIDDQTVTLKSSTPDTGPYTLIIP